MNIAPFSAMITHDGTITFTNIDGRLISVAPNSIVFQDVKDYVKSLGGSPSVEERKTLFEMSSPKERFIQACHGRIRIENNNLYHGDQRIHGYVAEHVLRMLEEGFDTMPILRFLDKLQDNPSYRAVNELFRFMDTNRMAISPDGDILAYKVIRSDYKDIYSATFDNSVGTTVEMARNEVNDDPTQTCSAGLHVCAMSYLRHYGSDKQKKDRVVICKINPKDVVSVPVDYNNAKMRVCRYIVVSEVTGDTNDILHRTTVWESDWDDWFDNDFIGDGDEWFDDDFIDDGDEVVEEDSSVEPSLDKAHIDEERRAAEINAESEAKNAAKKAKRKARRKRAKQRRAEQ